MTATVYETTYSNKNIQDVLTTNLTLGQRIETVRKGNVVQIILYNIS